MYLSLIWDNPSHLCLVVYQELLLGGGVLHPKIIQQGLAKYIPNAMLYFHHLNKTFSTAICTLQ